MIGPVAGIDHAIVGTGDLEGARALWARLGFATTPRGRHKVRAKIGRNAPAGAVFVSRRATGEVYSKELRDRYPGRDWILTRILWLCGREPGRNRFGGVDTMSRYIYIHGCPDTCPMGVPLSHGCVRMRNADVVDLFGRVRAGTPVHIAD